MFLLASKTMGPKYSLVQKRFFGPIQKLDPYRVIWVHFFFMHLRRVQTGPFRLVQMSNWKLGFDITQPDTNIVHYEFNLSTFGIRFSFFVT